MTIKHYLYDDIDEFKHYKDLLEDLRNVDEREVIELKVNSPGGRIDIGMTIIQAIKDCKGLVEIEVEHCSYSMASIIALAGDKLTFRKNTFLMFHDYSTVEFGKGNEIEKHTGAFSKHIKQTYEDICVPFLTKKECNKILDGSDLYICEGDDGLQERINRHFNRRRK